MNFQIVRFKEFLVRPALPKELERLSELAFNLLWTWDSNIRTLFRRLEPALWVQTHHNPVEMLGRMSQATLERAAADPRYVLLYRRACERLDTYRQKGTQPTDKLVAYFSMEYGLAESVPIYSGGLGVLSGDHLKAASDCEVPLVAVGLLYQKGYHQQYLNPDGWQQERYPVNDFYALPVTPVKSGRGDMVISLRLPTGELFVKVWQMHVGRVQLYLLDTNIAENARPEHREITDQLYGGDIHTRMRQEIVLGVGGMCALRALGLQPTVFHMNEGHSAFLALERVRLLMQEEKLSFEEAHEASRSNNVFTTHTPVPAGIDLFAPGLMHEYFQDYCRENGIPFEALLSLGRVHPTNEHEPFSMAVAAFRTSAYRNAVSRLHQTVSQEMWQGLWPELPTWEIPITSITNGVHLPTWLNGDFAMLYDQYLQPDWRERHKEPQTWDLIREIPSSELWEAHKRRKRHLLSFVRERVTESAIARKASLAEVRRLGEVLDAETFTIGFARRFATYKRATLLFRDVRRLKKILTNPDMPVQIVVAGKAHPKDHPGKSLIREIVQLSRDPEINRHLVFLEDYGIEVGRELVQGVDLWLNNPRRGEEACGTSGMKAGLNGVLNLSILDGWFDEAYEVSGGWAIGDREPYSEDQDEIHASAIYSLLENEIVPLYYNDREEDVPVDWVRRMRQSLANLSPRFNSLRMVEEYRSQLYEPAHQAYRAIRQSGFASIRERMRWKSGVDRAWERVRFVETGPELEGTLLSGQALPLRTVADLGGLNAEDVRVEAVVGRVGINGQLEQTEVLTLPVVGKQGEAFVFARDYVPAHTGRLGFSIRISPNHSDDPLTRPCNSLIKWN